MFIINGYGRKANAFSPWTDSEDNLISWNYTIMLWKRQCRNVEYLFLLSFVNSWSMQDSTLLLNTTDNDIRKV